MSILLFVANMQEKFVPAIWQSGVDEKTAQFATDLVKNTRAIIESAREDSDKITVVFSYEVHRNRARAYDGRMRFWDRSWQVTRPPELADEFGYLPDPAVRPKDHEPIFENSSGGIIENDWFRTFLANKGIRHMVIVGGHLPMMVKAMNHVAQRGLQIYAPSEVLEVLADLHRHNWESSSKRDFVKLAHMRPYDQIRANLLEHKPFPRVVPNPPARNGRGNFHLPKRVP